jgi:MtrB/PioB family decaheme-associated outer membrane protein
MRTLIWLALAIGLQAPAFAEEAKDTDAAAPPAESTEKIAAPEFAEHRIDFGLQNADADTLSSRFREYRDLPNGVFLPYARFLGDTGKLRYDLRGRNVLQQDASYRLLLAPDSFRLIVDYDRIPHRFGNNGRTLFHEVGPGQFLISDTLQQAHQDALVRQRTLNPAGVNFAFLNSLVLPSLNAQSGIDLALQRERGRAEVRLTPEKPYDVRVVYAHEKRTGDRAVGTSFGFGNVVESPEPINYRTQDIGATAEYGADWGRVNATFNYNWFSNNIAFHTFDNPWRRTDSTDASAYTGPGAGSINGPSFGRASLPPDNQAVTGGLGVAFKLAGRSRLGASVAIGQWTQNDTAFIPYTSNSAVATSPLPANSLDGKIDTLNFNAYFLSRFAKGATFHARYKRYDLDNKTPRIRFPGYVRYDAVFEDIPRISVPYGYTNDRFDASLAYDFGKVTAEAAYRHEKMDRTFRETEKTDYNAFLCKVDLRANTWLVLRGTLETGKRDYDGLEILLSEEASFQEPENPTNLLALPTSSPIYASLGCGSTICNLRYDQAKKKINRYGAHLVLTPAGTATVTASYLYGKDDYDETRFGLISAKTQTFSFDVDYTPGERASLFAYYNYEKLSDFQRGRQSGATVSNDPRADWTSNVDDKVNTFGAGGTFNLVKEKLDLNLNGSYQKVDGNNALFSPPGGTPDFAISIPNYDDTKLYTLGGEFLYKVTRVLVLGFGGWYEQYEISDAQTSNLVNYVPGSLFLNPVDGDYKGHVLYVKASYAW